MHFSMRQMGFGFVLFVLSPYTTVRVRKVSAPVVSLLLYVVLNVEKNYMNKYIRTERLFYTNECIRIERLLYSSTTLFLNSF